jgi:hypothetical protein
MRSHRRLRVVGALAALTMLLAACDFVTEAERHQANDPDTRPWWCDSHLGDGEGGHGSHDTPHYDGVEKGMLSWDDCLAVSEHLDNAREFAMQFPTLGDAEDAGFVRTVNYATGMGTHHRNPNSGILPAPGVFNPDEPTYLQYGGNGDDAPLVGMSWYVNSGDMPPEGFEGDNDWWHVHEALCFRNGLVIFDGPCPPGSGGTTIDLSNYWMIHAWIVGKWQHRPDVFENHHPCLLSSGMAPDDHMCWEMAFSEGGHM